VAGAPEKRVRLVTAPRASDVANPATGAPVGMVSSDTVLRQPQNIDAIPLATTKPAPREKRRDSRRKPNRFTTQSYQVPSESRRASRPVIVVRPMQLDTFR
jgi:hypothetical protein